MSRTAVLVGVALLCFVANAIALYQETELTPDRPAFVMFWCSEKDNDLVDVAFAVRKDSAEYRRSNAKVITLELLKKDKMMLSTDLMPTPFAKQIALSLAQRSQHNDVNANEIRELFQSEDVDFYQVCIQRALAENARIVIRSRDLRSSRVGYWFSIQRFIRNRLMPKSNK